MPTDLGPPHDRIQLSPVERRVIASLEYHLAEEERAAARPSARARRSALALGQRLADLAPLLLPLAIVLTLAALSASTVAGVAFALVTGLLLVLTIVRAVRSRRDRRGEGRRPPG
jgi:hypothetical protein